LSSKQLSQIDRITKIINNEKKSPSGKKKTQQNSIATNSQFTTLNGHAPLINHSKTFSDPFACQSSHMMVAQPLFHHPGHHNLSQAVPLPQKFCTSPTYTIEYPPSQLVRGQKTSQSGMLPNEIEEESQQPIDNEMIDHLSQKRETLRGTVRSCMLNNDDIDEVC